MKLGIAYLIYAIILFAIGGCMLHKIMDKSDPNSMRSKIERYNDQLDEYP